MTIRIGLIGAGKWGKNHAKNFKRLHKNKICNFVGIADPNPDVRLFANEIEVEYYEDYKELIGHVDAISISLNWETFNISQQDTYIQINPHEKTAELFSTLQFT
jgi:lactate dehydrogenase-like 2-hydroxyacid dehydrogenase